jgi:hypothetical protein
LENKDARARYGILKDRCQTLSLAQTRGRPQAGFVVSI